MHLLGVIAHQVGTNDVAVDLITKAVTVRPDYAEAHNNLGNAFQDLGRQDEAVASYRKAIALKPAYANAHNNLGTAFRYLGRLDDALENYRKALAINPNFAEAHSNLGLTLQDLGRLEDAVVSHQKALSLNPNYAELHNNLGIALSALGRLEDAMASYREALNYKPDNAEAHYNLGKVLKDLGKLDEALASYEKALVITPEFAEAHYNLGTLLQDRGKLDEALASYQKALTINPYYTDAHNNLGNVLKSLGKLEEALKVFNSLDTADGYAAALECLFALGRYDEFYEMQHTFMDKNRTNIRAAAISCFASQQLNHLDPHPFCKKPIDFLRVYKCLDDGENHDGLLMGLIDEIKGRLAIWEPPLGSTRGGFLTATRNLFDNPDGRIADLEQIIKDNIEKYYCEFSSRECVFIDSFPKTLSLTGWFVRLLKGGHQTEHIHPGGWLSGVFYLQVPNLSNQQEGSIELSLWGHNYPIINKNYPKKRYYPKNGDLILFPSSLFHRTIPFQSYEERLCIAFDLIPNKIF